MLQLFKDAGTVAWPLALASIVGLAIFLERLYTLAMLQKLERAAMEGLLAGGPKSDSMSKPENAAAPVAQIVNSLAALRGADRESIQTATEIALSLQRLRLRRYLGTLATIGSTSPFIGLFGTVLGVMTAFKGMSKAGLSGEMMASGISEALSATALGLLVAIPAVMGYNYLLGRTQAYLLQVQADVALAYPLLNRETANAEKAGV